VLECAELPGATALLEGLYSAGFAVYISSNTPEEFLGELIAARNWNKLIKGYFGFPRVKTETVTYILSIHNAAPSEVIIVGDGKSDEVSALENSCSFLKVISDRSLIDFHNAQVLPTTNV
jgi:phosphoglycolate phosphatase-like HAD superfamily hydrolase